jgi:hypothetical protein
MYPSFPVKKIGRLLVFAALLIATASTASSQVLVPEGGEESKPYEFRQDGNKFIYTFNRPNVRRAITDYKDVRLEAGDRITVEAGGCVQTGGYGPTWKLYVDPHAPGEPNLYRGLIGMPYLTKTFPESPSVRGMVRIKKLLGRVYVVPSFKDDSGEAHFLRLGYEDDNYDDNGYYGHDDGTADQCKGVGNATVIVTITRDIASITKPFSPAGNWIYTMKSHSGQTWTGALTLQQNGNNVSGTFSPPDGTGTRVWGTYDPATDTLTLSRDTGLDTIQRYRLRRLGNKIVGDYHNEGKHADSGTIEIDRVTL